MPKLSLETRLSRLETMDRQGLAEQWGILSTRPIPKNMSIGVLRLLIAYKLQANENPKLVKHVHQRLSTMARQMKERGPAALIQPRKAPPGTRLVRSWKDETHEVVVMEKGYAWKGQTYDSLSKVASAITGTHWNGPRFFGLRDAK